MMDELAAVEAALDAAREQCTRFLAWHGRREPADLLGELPSEIVPDLYGRGGVVTELESRVAQLLGKPAALFLPSGTMAQQIALRVHADRRATRVIVLHPTCHLELHEGRAHERLHGLVGRPTGPADALLTLDDLAEVHEPIAALLLELPQREIGGQLPTWADLVAQTSWARERGAAVHLDGARLWECGAAYGRPLEQIAALFDSVYVSFYKGLGAITGSVLAGEADLVAEAAEWRHRHGGTLYALWPYAASALAALEVRLPRMAAYLDHAVAIADAVRDLDGVRLQPDPPHTSMLHLHLRTSVEQFDAARLAIATSDRIWTFGRSFPSGQPDWRVVELAVGDATLEFQAGEVRRLVERLL